MKSMLFNFPYNSLGFTEEIDTVESLAPVAVVEGVDSLKAAVVGVSSAP